MSRAVRLQAYEGTVSGDGESDNNYYPLKGSTSVLSREFSLTLRSWFLIRIYSDEAERSSILAFYIKKVPQWNKLHIMSAEFFFSSTCVRSMRRGVKT